MEKHILRNVADCLVDYLLLRCGGSLPPSLLLLRRLFVTLAFGSGLPPDVHVAIYRAHVCTLMFGASFGGIRRDVSRRESGRILNSHNACRPALWQVGNSTHLFGQTGIPLATGAEHCG